MLPTRERLPRARRFIAFTGAVALAGVGLTALPATATVNEDTGVVTIDLLGINDFHGRIDRTLNNDGSVNTPGAVALASAVEEARAANPDTVFVSAGDNFGASTFVSMINDDVPTTAALDAMGLATSALGNHEFDQGQAALDARIYGSYTSERAPGPNPAIAAPYLGANVYEAGTTNQAYDGHEIVEVPAGDDGPVRVGFVGLLTPDMASLVAPDGIADLDFGDMAEAAEAEVAAIADDADVIVILVHAGSATPNLADVTDADTDFGALVNSLADNPDVDAVFSGHTHVEYAVDVARTGDAAGNEPLPVVQTGALNTTVAQITVEYDPADGGAVISTDSSFIDLRQQEVLEDNDVVDAVAAIVDDALEVAAVLGAEVIGTVDGPLYRAQQTDGSENRGGESTIGNLIADAQLWALEDQFGAGAADIAFMNPGGIRADIIPNDAGEVTYEQVATAQPFGNTLVTTELTGAQVIDILEEQWQPDGADRPFLKLGVNDEFYYLYDPEAARGERVTAAYLNGVALDEDETYTIVTNSFLASGGDNFGTFAEGANTADRGLADLQAFVDYFAAHEPVEVPTIQRSIGVHWISDQQAPFAIGDDIEFDLSSLTFSAGAPVPEELGLSLFNPATEQTIDLGTVDVDASIVDTLDESGRAEIRVTVPEIEGLTEAPEMWQILVSEDVNDYSLWFDVALVGESDTTPTPTPTPTESTPGDEDDDDGLADTGANLQMAGIGGLLMLTLGGITVVAVRRRHAAQL